MKNVSWVNFLKLKASYGENGNDNINNYLYTNRYSVVNAGGNIAVSPSSTKGNKDITWETIGEFNAGVEFGLFNNRLNGGIEYFWRKTSDMLYSFTLPRSSGFGNYWANIGDMRNQGVEVELNADLVRMQNFKWNFGVNLTHYKNKVLSMPDERKTMTALDFDGKAYQGYANGNFFLGEDLSLGSYYMPVYAGVGEDGASLWYKDVVKQKDDTSKPLMNEDGTPMTDEEGNQLYEQMDYIEKGTTSNYSDATDYIHSESLLPKVYGGFNTSFELYGFELGLDFAYQIGGKVYDSEYASFMGSPTSSGRGNNFHADLLNAWTPTNTNTDIPRLQYGDQYSSSLSTRFLTKASYLNLQNLTFAYNLPTSLLRKAKIDAVKLYVNATNVWMWSKRQGLDPRTAATDFSYGTSNASYYSTIRTISAGVKVTF